MHTHTYTHTYTQAQTLSPLFKTGRLFVRNLAFACSEEDLKAHFARFGPIGEVNILVDTDSKQSKGYAFVTYVMASHALAALTALDGSIFQVGA